MSETSDSAAGATAGTTAGGHPIEYPIRAAYTPGSSGMLRLGGALGIAASVVGLVIMVAACAGFGKVIVLSIVPVALSVPGLIISIVGAVFQKRQIVEETHVLQALFVNVIGLVGGLFELAAWQNWSIYHH